MIYLYPLRKDLNITQVEQDNKNLVILSDNFGFSEYQIAISLEFFWLLTQITKPIIIEEFCELIGLEDSQYFDHIYQEIKKLEEYNFIETPQFLKWKEESIKEYLESPIRPSILSGISFPSDRNEFITYMNHLFSLVPSENILGNANSVIVPHLDLLTGLDTQKVYCTAYHSIRNTDFDTIVIFGTSHYSATNRFMLTKKHFETPNGLLETDINLIDYMINKDYNYFLIDDLAHKPEHSIEIQAALIKYYFNDKNFKIIPILVSGFFDFFDNDLTPDSDLQVNNFIELLKNSLIELNRKPIFISSVDFSHFGLKFNDNFDALDELENAKRYDKILIENIINKNHNQFFEEIKKVEDKWKICGTAPIFVHLKTVNFENAKLLSYNMWYEKETKSAVSCANISFYN